MDYILTADGMVAADSYLMHYGVKGMKWGVRRYQDYGEGGYNPKQQKKIQKRHDKAIKALSKGKTKKFLKYSGYVSDEELHQKAERKRDITTLTETKPKEYSEAQKAMIHVLETAAKVAVVSGAAYLGGKFVAKKIKSSPVYHAAVSTIKASAEKGKAFMESANKAKDATVKGMYNVGKTIVDTGEAAKKVGSNVNKMASNPLEIKARLAAQKAVKEGATKEVAQRIYKRIMDGK